ncbi:MAG: tRNA (N6-isopentenyl adenosine(37)-C2)-methylthiotransferase MiaB [bacterium]|nr:tRNA (N6-isopentenyl adenosine(37)-C2)-methylthiotransferase MiaB [bacterium]
MSSEPNKQNQFDRTAISTNGKSKVFIKTFGCQMNEYDSLKLARILAPKYDQVQNPLDADLVLINTCSVRDKPEQKLYSILGEVKEIKEINPNLMIGVGGCVAQQEGANITKRIKDVDFVFGTHNLSLVPSLIELRKSGSAPQVAVDYREDWEDLPLAFTEESRVAAYVSISRGCNKNCTYCIVPTTRGPEVSRSSDEIIREIRLLVHRGAKEIFLLGQTVNSYGLDLTPKRSFVWLLDQVAAITGVERIRFMSPHPQEVREDFIDLVCSNPKICRHIHMPLQSGSDRILKLMNRNYRRQKYLSIIEKIKDRVPDMAITTDIIVGFPGETDADFRDTLDIMEQVKFNSSYSYVFSARPGTEAAKMADILTEEDKLKRIYELQEKQNKMTDVILASWVGKTAQILIEGHSTSDPTCMKGRTSQNILVNMLNSYPDLKVGDIRDVKISKTFRYTLGAELTNQN